MGGATKVINYGGRNHFLHYGVNSKLSTFSWHSTFFDANLRRHRTTRQGPFAHPTVESDVNFAWNMGGAEEAYVDLGDCFMGGEGCAEFIV